MDRHTKDRKGVEIVVVGSDSSGAVDVGEMERLLEEYGPRARLVALTHSRPAADPSPNQWRPSQPG